MSVARDIFLQRVATIRSSIDDFKLRDLPPLPLNDSHNRSVRMIRNGLAVQAFNIFEDFIKGRTNEFLSSISSSGVSFSVLPGNLQKAATIDVVSAMQFQMKLKDKSTRMSFIQDYCRMVHSTSLVAFDIPGLSFFHSNSNISKEQFRDAMAAFGVNKPWAQISGLCSRMGTSAIPAEDLFDSLASKRHEAAHNPNAAVSEVDLAQSLKDASSLAGCFDLLLSYCLKILIGLSAIPSNPLLGDHANIPIRFIRFRKSNFGEMKEGGKKFIHSSKDYVPLVAGARARAVGENGALARFDEFNNLVSWELP